MALSTIHVMAPDEVVASASFRVRIWHIPGAIADMVAVVINNANIETDVTSYLTLVTSGAATFIEMIIALSNPGDYVINVENNVTGDWGVASIKVVAASTDTATLTNEINKLRTEISRVRTLIKGRT